MSADTSGASDSFMSGGDAQKQQILNKKFKILGEIHSEGIKAYKAVDLQSGKTVVIKMLSCCLGKKVFDEVLFKTRLCFKLSHPNIIGTDDLEADGELQYFVTEYVDGVNLEQRIFSSGIFSAAEAVEIFSRVADALDFAHRQHIYHGGIKLSDIIITRDGKAKLAGFGISTAMDAVRKSASGQKYVEPPFYQAPERVRGGQPDSPSDVYSLAAVIYECLCGHPPFWGSSVEQQILKDKPAALEELSEKQNAAILKALSKNPGDRQVTATEIVKQLSEGLIKKTSKGQAKKEQRISAAESLERPSRPVKDAHDEKDKHKNKRKKVKVLVLSAVFAVVILTIVVGISGWSSHKRHERELEASRLWQQAQSTAARLGYKEAIAITDHIIGEFSEYKSQHIREITERKREWEKAFAGQQSWFAAKTLAEQKKYKEAIAAGKTFLYGYPASQYVNEAKDQIRAWERILLEATNAELLTEARKFSNAGKLDKAEENIIAVLRTDPKNTEAQMLKQEIYSLKEAKKTDAQIIVPDNKANVAEKRVELEASQRVLDKNARLMQAAEKGVLHDVQTMLASGAEVNAKRTSDGITALWLASLNGRTEVVKLLLEKGADVNARNTDGITALYLAAQEGNLEIVKFLLGKNAEVNVKANNGVTSLWIAAQNGHTDVVKLLLEKGAEVNSKRTSDGVTALEVAKTKGRTDIVQLLEEADAKKSEAGISGKSARLVQAVKDGDLRAEQRATVQNNAANLEAEKQKKFEQLLNAAKAKDGKEKLLLLEQALQIYPDNAEAISLKKEIEAVEDKKSENKVIKPELAQADDRVVVVVNGDNITESRLDAEIKPQLQKMATQLPSNLIEQYKKQLRQQVLDKIIIEQLLDEKVKAAKVVVTDEEATEQIKEIASQQQPPLSMEDFKALVVASGQSFDEVKRRIQKGLAYQKLMEVQWAGKIDVKEDDIRNYYFENKSKFETPEQVRASHILIKPDTNINPENAKTAAKAKARDLLNQIRSGADFATLAKANSDCPSRIKGGDLGFFGRGQMVAEFEKVAFELPVGQVSDVVETSFGYHIIIVTDRKGETIATFEQSRDRIEKLLVQQKQAEFAEKYVKSLKENATIIYPDNRSNQP